MMQFESTEYDNTFIANALFPDIIFSKTLFINDDLDIALIYALCLQQITTTCLV